MRTYMEPATGPAYCQNCDWTGDASEVDSGIESFDDRVAPGEVCPVGECPECGSLCQLGKAQEPSGALQIIGRKVIVSREGVASFNRGWPCSTLRSSRAYWFEFDSRGNLIDTDCPESDDGSASVAMANDCKAFLFDGVRPEWAPV